MSAPTATEPDLLWTFGLPMLSVLATDKVSLNRDLATLILELERTQPTAAQSNVGGWQSAKMLETLRSAAIQELLAHIDVGVYLLMSRLIGEEEIDRLPNKWRINAWANVNRAAHSNGLHYHQGGFWSGVYYVAAATQTEDSDEGAIVFRNPGASHIIANALTAPRALKQAFQPEIAIRPSPGLLIIFPSWLEHRVIPHRGEHPRISIAFDVIYRG